jgi:Cyclic nucleotide-binding domain.
LRDRRVRGRSSFIIEDGSANLVSEETGEDGKPRKSLTSGARDGKVVGRIERFGFFGEIALVSSYPAKISVVAGKRGASCLCVTSRNFERMGLRIALLTELVSKVISDLIY